MFAALQRIGWRETRRKGSHRLLERPHWQPFPFSFHDDEEIGPRMLVIGCP